MKKSIRGSGQFTVSAASEERKRKITKLLEKTGTDKLSTAVWKAIEFYLEHQGGDKGG